MAGFPRRVAFTAVFSFFAPFCLAPSAPAQVAGLRPPSREILDYSVEWRMITAGKARVTNIINPNGRAETQLHLESSGLVSRLYKVQDDYTAALNSGFCVQNTLTTAHEGSRAHETRVTFENPGKDPQWRKATYTDRDLVKNTTSSQDSDVPACVHEVIGGMMYLRSLKLEPGKTVQVPVSDGKKFAEVKVESQHRESVKTPLGTYNAIRYEIFVFDNVLYRRSGHLYVWMTDDDRRLPIQVQVRLQFTIGTITLQLQKEQRQ